MLYLVNGFSEAMKRDPNMKDIPYSLTKEEFLDIIHHADYKSVIGHDSLAHFLSELTGKDIPMNRQGITLNYEDTVIIVSLLGRLPEKKRHVEFKGRMNFTFKRFEKQTAEDLLKSAEQIKQMVKMEE